jgi:hypothetical protein
MANSEFLNIDNFDGDCYWYRKVAVHSRPEFEKIALEFTAEIATALKVQPPSVHWYVAADKCGASVEFNRCVETANGRYDGFAIDDCPIDLPCEYFRWPNQDGQQVGHGGFICRGDSRIMIAADRSDADVLSAIAHECRHLYQDARNGPDWHFENLEESEYDAEHFECTMREQIGRALAEA